MIKVIPDVTGSRGLMGWIFDQLDPKGAIKQPPVQTGRGYDDYMSNLAQELGELRATAAKIRANDQAVPPSLQKQIERLEFQMKMGRQDKRFQQ